MGLRFRPYPGFTITTFVMVAILIGLGVWQLERLQWKLALIAHMNRKMHAAVLPVDDAKGGMLGSTPDNEYTRVSLHGRFDNSKEAYVFTTDAGGNPVYHVLTPFRTDVGHIFLVDRGAVPKEHLAPVTRAAGQMDGDVSVTGIWRTPDARGFFTPPPDAAHHIWYSRDLDSIAAADHIRLAAPVLIEADAATNPGGWPLGGQTVVDLPNNHLSYAFTWFGLAAGLIGVYLAYHVSKGRLSWRT